MQALHRLATWLLARPAWALASLFTLALVIRLAALGLTHRTLPAGDELELFVRAARAVLGPPLLDDTGRAPGLLFFYEMAFRAFSVHAVVAKLANVVVSAITVVPVAFIGRALGGLRVGGLAALGVAVYPTFVAFSHFLWPAPLYILLVTTGVALLLVSVSRTGWRGALGLGLAGLVIGASALVKESGIAFPVVAALWVSWRAWRSGGGAGPSAVRGALVAAGAAASIVPWVVHIQSPDLPFALITRTGYMNLFIGNHPQGHGIGMQEYPNLGATRLESESVARERAIASIRQRGPAWPLEKIASEVPRFFTPTSFAVRRLLAPADDAGAWRYRMTWSALDRPGVRALCVASVVVGYLLALGLGSIGLVLAPRSDVTALFALFVASQLAPSIATFAMSRFRLASMVCFIVGAAYACVHGRSDWSEAPGWRRGLAMGTALALLTLAALDGSSVLESTGR